MAEKSQSVATNPRFWELLAANNQQRVDEDDARAKLARAEAAVARVVLADAAMPDDLRQFAERMGVSAVMSEVWRTAYLAGFRAAAARHDVTDEVRYG